MTNSFKKRIQSSFSIFNIFALTFQSFLPGFFMLFPAKAYAVAQQEVGKVDLEFSQEENVFDLTVVSDSDVEYRLEYASQESDTKNGVKGTAKHSEGVASATEYAGTCSVDDCVPNKVDFGRLELPNASFATDFAVLGENLWLVSDKKAEVPTVELNTIYSAPQNSEVQVVFTKLPENPGSLVVEEITLTEEQAQQLGAYSTIAYDISSDMENGTFEYDLKLPLPEGADEKAGLVYAETVEELDTAVAVEDEEISEGVVSAKGLDHFTVFVVTFEDPQNPTPVTPGYNDIWFDYAGGTITQVPSGTNGITSASGNSHAEITGPVFTRWGGYNNTFPALGYDTRLDVYLDMALADGSDKRFDFSSAINTPAGGHRRDFIIHLGTNPSAPGQWLVSASNNAPGWPGNPARNPADITESGWYTIEHAFRNVGGVLEVTISLYKRGEASSIGSWVLSDSSDIIGTTVGGNRYGWFTSQRFDFDWLAIDNTEINVFDPTFTTIEIPKDNTNWMFNRDASTASPYEFNADQASIGSGSLYALPISANASDKLIAENFMYENISELRNIQYDFMIGSGGEAADANHFYMNVYANFGESDPDNYYDCRYNVVPSVGSTAGFTTVTFNLNQAYPVTTRGTSPYTCPAIPADMEDLSPGSIVRAIALNVGDTSTNDQGLDGYLDNVVVDKGAEVTIYDFEPDLEAPATPTGIRILDHNNTNLGCGGYTNHRFITIDWDDNGEADFDHYDYRIREGSIIAHPTVSKYSGNIRDEDGLYKYSVRAVDESGNASDWTDWCEVTLDRQAPSVPTLIEPTNNAIVNGATLLSDWSDVSGAVKYIYESYHDAGATNLRWHDEYTQSQKTATNVANATFWWRVKAVDAAGNQSAWSDLWKVTIDNDAPDVEVTTPAAGLVNGIVEVRGTVTDANPHHYWFVIQNSSGTTVAGPGTVNDTTSFTNKLLLNWDTTSLPSGEYTIKLEARDSANNKDAGSVDWVKVQVDNTRPTVTITSPANDSAFNGPFSVLGTADDADSGVKDIRVRFRNESDNALVATFWATYDSGSKTWSLDINDGTNIVPEGNYRIVVHVRDNNGNSRNATRRRVHVDTTNPSSIITTFDLEDGGEVETAVFDGLIQGTATDEPTEIASGVTEVLLEIMHTPFGESEGSFWNGSDWQSTTATVSATGTTNWEYQIPEESVLEGTYTIESHAVDAAGNVESTYTITIVYDRTIPEVSLTIDPATPDAQNGWYKTNPTVTLTANDNYSVDYIEYQWNSTAGAWTTYSSPINPPGEGQNVLYYRSVDTVGNVSDIGVKEVKYDATAPTEGPLNVRVENVGSTTADGKWQKPNGADYVHEYRLSWKHENGTEHSATVSSETYEHKLDNLFDGLWEFRVTAADAAGHTISAATKFRVGPEPSSDSGSVLGATTDEGTGTGGSFIGSQNSSNTENSQDSQESESNEEKDGSSQTDESGAVLGDTDNSCATWKFYLPLFLLLIQVLFAVSLEIANREPNAKKLLFALAISGLLMGAFYMLRDTSCFEGTGIMQSLAKWFVPVSVGLAFLLRGIGSMTVEEK